MVTFALADRAALVTGASSGIGRAIAVALAAEGAHLVLAAHPAERAALDALAAELAAARPVRVTALAVDLAEPGGAVELHRRATAAEPRIDVLVSCAGLYAYGELCELPRERQVRIVRVNAEAPLVLAHAFARDMRARGEGRILNVSSVAAFQPTAYQATYGATKAFVQSLTEALRVELEGTGVVASTLNPPFTRTPLLDGLPQVPWTRLVPMAEVDAVARAALDALRTGRAVTLLDARSRLVHGLVPRLAPRALVARAGRWLLRPRA